MDIERPQLIPKPRPIGLLRPNVLLGPPEKHAQSSTGGTLLNKGGFIRMLFVAQSGKSKTGMSDVARFGSLVQVQPDSITYGVFGIERE